MTAPAPFRIDPELQALIAPLSDDERDQLEANLRRDGCRDPLVVWADAALLVDGHNRFDICSRHAIPFEITSIAFEDRTAARVWVRWNQLGRRNLTDDQRAMQVAGLVDDLAAQSKKARAQAGRRAGGDATPEQQVERNRSRDTASRKRSDKTSVRTTTSKRARVSERKVKQAAALKKRAPELAEQVTAGAVTLAEAVRQTKPAIRAQQLAETIWPEGKYGVMLADPPWKPDEGLLDPTRRIENQYPTMTLAELVAERPKIDARALEDCVLLLWTTTQKLGDAIALVDAWGFTVKSGAVWIKDSIGMGYWFRGRHELVILATRGTPRTPLEADRPDSVITAPRRGHSEKPDELYALAERMFPTVPKVELFARANRPGWARATNEIELRSA